MILWFYRLYELDFQKLMSVYEEGNVRNGAILYPDKPVAAQKQLAEYAFEDYLRHAFFRQKNAAYCVLADGRIYYSAVRIEPFEDGYLLSALETGPSYRRKGYGERLIKQVLSACTERGMLPIYSHVHNSNIASLNLHLKCGFCVYKDIAKYLDGTISDAAKTLVYNR